MLTLLVLFLAISLLSSLSDLYVGGVEYPHVAPSPSVHFGRRTGIIQEKECFVSRLCEYKILEENFSCKVSKYVISRGPERTLPKWLWFDKGNQTLKGFASSADEGLNEILIVGLKRHQDISESSICGLLTVKIVVWSLKYFPLFAQNIPTSPVINDRYLRTSSWQAITCHFNEPIVLATLVMAGNLYEMNGKQKVNLLDRLLQTFRISIYKVFIASKDDSLSSLLHTSHVLASGPGADRSTPGPSTTISWHVTCGVIHLDNSIFQVMEKIAQQSVNIDNVSYAPVGWYVVTGFQKHHVRKRRNIAAGTTTPAYSTVPVSRATVITTKIRTRKTTYVSSTRTFTWSRVFPTFSSSITVTKTSLYSSESLIVSSRLNNETTMTSSRNASILSQISVSRNQMSKISNSSVSRSIVTQSRDVASKQKTSKTIFYNNISSTVMLPSRNASSQLTQNISYLMNISSQIHPTSEITIPITDQPSSSKFSTFVQSSFRTRLSVEKSSTNLIIIPSSKIVTFGSSVQPTGHSVIKSTSGVLSLVISSSFSTEKYSNPTSSLHNSTISFAQSSYSNVIDSVRSFSRATYSPALHVTTSRTINDTKLPSSVLNHTLYESFSSSVYTRSNPTIMATPSTPIYVSTLRVTATSNTPSSSYQKQTTHRASSISKTIILNVSRTTEMLYTTSITSPVQSTQHWTSKFIIKPSTSNGATRSTNIDSRSNKTVQASSRGGISSEILSHSSVEATLTSSWNVIPSSMIAATTHVTVPSQSGSKIISSLSTVWPTASSLQTDQLRSDTSIKTTISSQTKTIQFGSFTPTIVPNPSASLLLTTHISPVNTLYRSFSSPVVGHDSLHPSSTSPASTEQNSLQIETIHTSSPHSVSTGSQYNSPFRSSSKISAEATLSVVIITSSPVSPNLSSIPLRISTTTTITPSSVFLQSPQHSPTTSLTFSSLKIIPSSLTVLSTIPSSVILQSPQHSPTTPLIFSSVKFTPSLIFQSSYAALSSSLTVLTTNSLGFVSSYHTNTSIVVLTTYLSKNLSSEHKPPSSLLLTSSSSMFLSSYYAPTSSLKVNSTPFLWSSYYTKNLTSSAVLTFITSSFFPTFVITIFSSDFLSPLSTVVSTSTSSSYHTAASPSTINNIIFSSVHLLSQQSPTLLSTVTSTISMSGFSSFLHTLALPSTVVTNISSLTLPSSQHAPILLSTFNSVISTTSTSVFSSFRHTPASSSLIYNSLSQSVLLSQHASSLLTTVTSNTSTPVFPSFHQTPAPLSTTRSLDLHSSSNNLSNVIPTTPSPLESSYQTLISTTAVTTNYSSSFVPSFYPTVSSRHSLTTLNFLTTLGNLQSSATHLLTAYKTFSVSSLSSSIVSSQLSISSDLSKMVPPTTTSSTLSSQTNASWTLQSSFSTGNRRPTTTILPSRTSMKIPVSSSSSILFASSTLPKPSSSLVTALPTTPSKGSPKIYNSFDQLRVSLGKVFDVQIPVDTFHDREDGNTRHLRLKCLTVDHERLSSDLWLQFNSTTQTLYGLVLKSQLARIGSSTEFLLTASDHDGNTVYDAFTVYIEDSEEALAAMFSIKLPGTNLKLFSKDLGNVLSLVQIIAGYYGDKDESSIRALSVSEGSVVFTWSNSSLQTCDEALINEVAGKIITSQGEIELAFYNALSPRFKPNDIFVNYTGPCVLHTTESPGVSELSSHETSLWLKYVLPAFVSLVIVIVVVCLVVRRHSGVKILKENKQLFKRRKPIILDGELDMSTLSRKPIELPEDSLSPVQFPRETSLGMPDYDDEDDMRRWPSPISAAPSYQRLPPRYSDGGRHRYNTTPPPYKLPPSY